MKEKNPIEPLVDEISRILQYFHENKEVPITGDVTPEQAEMLMQLEMHVSAARTAYDIALKEEGLTPQDVKETMKKRGFMDPKSRDLLEKLERMEREARQIQFAIQHAIKNSRKITAKTGKRVTKGRPEGPRLGIGFRKGWKPL